MGSITPVDFPAPLRPPGYLSGSLPWLTTIGRHIVSAETGTPVLLRGVNRSGLEYAEPARSSENGAGAFLAAAGLCENDIDEIARWGANILRLPFNQDWALNGRRGHPASAYLAAIDQVIAWASRRGLYTLLDLQWISADLIFGQAQSNNRVAPLPNLDSLEMWRMLAARYRDEPAVLYDIFNEPHHPLPGDPNPLLGISDDGSIFPVTTGRVTMSEWKPWARHLVRAIRSEHPAALIFVSGVDWGYDLRGMPLTVSDNSAEVFRGIVYSTHVYPQKGPPYPPLANRKSPRGADWNQCFGKLAQDFPVFATEWGVTAGKENDAADALWAEHLADVFNELGIGWTAWSWQDRPHLIAKDSPRPYEPTRYGDVVRRYLRQSKLERQILT